MMRRIVSILAGLLLAGASFGDVTGIISPPIAGTAGSVPASGVTPGALGTGVTLTSLSQLPAQSPGTLVGVPVGGGTVAPTAQSSPSVSGTFSANGFALSASTLNMIGGRTPSTSLYYSASTSITGAPSTPGNGIIGPAGINYGSITADTTTNGNGEWSGWYVLGAPSAGFTGGYNLSQCSLNLVGTTGAPQNVAGYVCVNGVTRVSANQGGTGGAYGNYYGQNFGYGCAVYTTSGGTYQGLVNCMELDTGIAAGTSAADHFGETIVLLSQHAVRGVYDDAALDFGMQDGATATWHYGVDFGSYAHAWPFGADSTLIGAEIRQAPTTGTDIALNGVDFSNVTFQTGGCAFKSNGFCVTPIGGTITAVASSVANRTFTSADINSNIVRTNAGSAMADTLPACSGLGATWVTEITNADSAGTDTITPASGTIGGGSALALPAGTTAMVSCDPSNNYQVIVGNSLVPTAASVTTLVASNVISSNGGSTPTATSGVGGIYGNTTNGLVLFGDGSSFDLNFFNSAGTSVCENIHSASYLSCGGINVTGSSNPKTGINSPAANSLGFYANFQLTGDIDATQHWRIATYGTPTIASGACGTGTNGTISGSDQVGTITVGSATTTACTVTFASTFTTVARKVNVSACNSTAATNPAYVATADISTTAFVMRGAALTSGCYAYDVM